MRPPSRGCSSLSRFGFSCTTVSLHPSLGSGERKGRLAVLLLHLKWKDQHTSAYFCNPSIQHSARHKICAYRTFTEELSVGPAKAHLIVLLLHYLGLNSNIRSSIPAALKTPSYLPLYVPFSSSPIHTICYVCTSLSIVYPPSQ